MQSQPQNPGRSDPKTQAFNQLLCSSRMQFPTPQDTLGPQRPPSAPGLLDGANILRVALHLLPGPLLPQLPLELLNLLPLGLMLLLGLPHFLHIAQCLRVPALLQVLRSGTEGGDRSGSAWGVNITGPAPSNPSGP